MDLGKMTIYCSQLDNKRDNCTDYTDAIGINWDFPGKTGMCDHPSHWREAMTGGEDMSKSSQLGKGKAIYGDSI